MNKIEYQDFFQKLGKNIREARNAKNFLRRNLRSILTLLEIILGVSKEQKKV